MCTKIILNGSYGGFSINEKIMNEYNKKTNSNLYFGSCECRFIPEFIERIEEGENIGGLGSDLYIGYVPKDAMDYNAWDIEEYDGVESIIIDYSKIKVRKMTDFFDIMNKILHDDSINLSAEMRFEYLRMLAPKDALENQDFDALLQNAELLPVFSSGFREAEESFYSKI
jgi:hypothetical protein